MSIIRLRHGTVQETPLFKQNLPPIWSAVRPRTALEYFGLRHVSCRFDIFWIAGRPRTALDYIEPLAALDCDTSHVALGVRHALVPLWYILDCGASPRRFRLH